MKSSFKAQLAKATHFLLTLVSTIFLIGVVVFVVCTGLDINPFRQTTTGFLMAGFAGLIGVAGMIFLLNVATNISLIADSRISQLEGSESNRWKGWLITMASISVVLVGLIFASTYMSKERYIAVVSEQAHEVLKENDSLVQEIGSRLKARKPADFKRVSEICEFLENQRSNLPSLRIIYSDSFSDKLALYDLSTYFSGDIDKDVFNPHYFQCTKGFDCDYLKSFFTGQNVEEMKKYELRGDKFSIYIPYDVQGARFVLVFSQHNRYGKIGS